MAQRIDYSDWSLTFNEEFNDLNLWNGSGGVWKPQYHWGDDRINGELQFYVDPQKASSKGVNPFSIDNGILTIEAKPTDPGMKSTFDNRDYTSGVITTEKSFSQTYGYFEISAQVPEGKGLWPAFWLLPADRSWPPELDVMEILGQQPERVYMTSHSKQAATDHHSATVHDTSERFTKFGVEWTPDELIWYIDGVEMARGKTPGDMHKPMYLLANLAVGGGWPGSPNGNTEFPAEYKIDYIRAYTPGDGDGNGGGTLDPVADGGGTTSTAAPGPNGELAVVLSNATGPNGEQVLTGGYTLYPEQPSSTKLTGADMKIGGVADSAAATVTRDADGAVDVKLDSAWNSLKNVLVADDEAGSVTLDNFVHSDVVLGDGGNSDVTITGAKRGSVVTGDGNDVVDITVESNSSTSSSFRIETGEGDDLIRIRGGGSATKVTIDAGPGDNVIDVAGGANTLTGGPGADTYIFRALDAAVDQVRGFDADKGDRIEVGALLDGYEPGSSDAGDFVKLAEVDGSTRVQVDADGKGGGGVVDAAVLQGVTGLGMDAILYNGQPLSGASAEPAGSDDGVLQPVDEEPKVAEPSDPAPVDEEPQVVEPSDPAPDGDTSSPDPIAGGGTDEPTPVGEGTPAGATSVVFSQATGANGEQVRDDSYTHVADQPGAVTITGVEMDIAGVAASAAATVTRDEAGAVEVGLDSTWNSLKNVYVTEEDAGSVTVDNFVHADVALGDGGDSTVIINDAKRGSVVTGDGDDTVEINVLSNSDGTGNSFRVDTGGGDDVIRVLGGQSYTRAVVDAGDGNNVIEVGAGTHSLSAGGGADTYVFSVLDGQADEVSGFNADDGDVLDVGGILNGFDPASSSLADFVALEEANGNTTVRVSADGAAGSFVDLAVLQDVTGLDLDSFVQDEGTIPTMPDREPSGDEDVTDPVVAEDPAPAEPTEAVADNDADNDADEGTAGSTSAEEDPAPAEPTETVADNDTDEDTAGSTPADEVTTAGATSVVFSQATGSNGEQVRTDSYTHLADQPGSVTLTGADLAIAGVPDSAAATGTRDDAGAVDVTLESTWNSLKNVYVSEEDAGTVTIDNFVHADVELGDGGDSNVTISGAKRGSVVTGDGDDVVEIHVLSNSSGTGNTFQVDTGAGNDVIRVLDGQSYTRAAIDAGDGDNVIEVGAGTHSLTAGEGADTYIFSVLDGTADEVFGFDPADGDALDIGSLLDGFDPANSNLSDFVALEETGGDTLVQVNASGGAGDSFADVAVLRDVTGLDLDILVQDGAQVAA